MEESIRKADILIEAIPYIRAFRGKVLVAKYGGSAIDNPAAMRGILQDLIFLTEVGIRSVLVHGGGPEINRRLSAAGQRSHFVNGLRVTDAKAIRIVSQALDEVNRRLVEQVRALGGQGIGVTPKQKAIAAEPHAKADELGFVGSVAWVQNGLLRRLLARHAIPVISPVGVGHGKLYNINADEVASEVAASLRAEKLVLLTNVRGILRQGDDPGSLISTVSVKETKTLLSRGVIQEGMIPKVNACVDALRRGVKKTHIIDAALPHALLLEIFTKQGIGTEIIRG
jgi:acetylglutamate kinase